MGEFGSEKSRERGAGLGIKSGLGEDGKKWGLVGTDDGDIGSREEIPSVTVKVLTVSSEVPQPLASAEHTM